MGIVLENPLAWSAGEFLTADPAAIVNDLARRMAEVYSGKHAEQIAAWGKQLQVLRVTLDELGETGETAQSWGVCLEYPLRRLERRIDVVILPPEGVVVLEFKVGADGRDRTAVRQVEDYALDLRDFHSGCRGVPILPLVVATEFEGKSEEVNYGPVDSTWAATSCGPLDLAARIESFRRQIAHSGPSLSWKEWVDAPYRPTPTILQAAEHLFAGHDVREIRSSSASADDLSAANDAVFDVISQTRRDGGLAVCFLTGVPGSGKTLAGLSVVTDQTPRSEDVASVYLSGTRPLVEVLRQAVAQDGNRRGVSQDGESSRTIRSKIQLLTGYLSEYLKQEETPPHEQVIIFDEAQRAWDAAYGMQQFERPDSEPSLFLEIMARRSDWAVIVALVGSGQEINRGEGGLEEWSKSLTKWSQEFPTRSWKAYLAPSGLRSDDGFDEVLSGGAGVPFRTDSRLHLSISERSFRWNVDSWVEPFLDGDLEAARVASEAAEGFPFFLTRSVETARDWLRNQTGGLRRCGLVASSGAKRLRAEGLGSTLRASELDQVAHWFLAGPEDIRSSYALETTVSEYTCQGLELDHVGLCWGGDLRWDQAHDRWQFFSLAGAGWNRVRKPEKQRYLLNSYRVLLTRAREATVIFVPRGSEQDSTRPPKVYDAIADALLRAGVRPLK